MALRKTRTEESEPALVVGTRRDTGEEVALRRAALFHHLFVLGVSGSGKSKLLVSLILQLINLGYACLVIDPHADLAGDVLLALWSTGFFADPRGYQRVQYLRFAGEGGRYPPWNVLAQPGQTAREIASWVWSALTRVWSSLGGGVAPMMQQVVQFGLVALVEAKRPITDLFRLLTDEPYRALLLSQVQDPQVRAFFAWFDGAGKRAELTAESALRRISIFLFSEALGGSLGCLENRLDMRAAMDNGVTLLCDLSMVGDEATRLLGSLLTGQAEAAALARADVPEATRCPAFLFLDEWSMFAAESEVALERMLALCRKYGLFVTLSCQALGQARSVEAAVQNCTPIVLRTGGLDSEWAAARVGTYDPRQVTLTASGRPTLVGRGEQQHAWADRLERLPARHAVMRLGEESIPFYTLGVPPVPGGERVLATLRAHYSQLLLRAPGQDPSSAPGTPVANSPWSPWSPAPGPTQGPTQGRLALPEPARAPERPVRRIVPWPTAHGDTSGERDDE